MKRLLLVSSLAILLAFSSKAQVLDSPILTEPPDVDIVVAPSVTLEWGNVNSATAYEVQISLTNNFSILVNSNPLVITNNYYHVPTGLLNNFTNYFWRVKAISSTGSSNFSQPRSFRTAGTPPQEIISLEEVIQNFNLMNSINPAQLQILLNRLEQALYHYNHNRIFVANIHLQLFKLRVYILMFSNILSNTDGERLLYNADKIIELINGDSPVPEVTVPNEFELKQNYPNPFNPSTTIEYTIPENSKVSLKIYDILGKEVATLVDKEQNQGTYIVIWDAKSASSGIYFYRLTSGNYSETKRMVLKK